jgi:hypothetical protein
MHYFVSVGNQMIDRIRMAFIRNKPRMRKSDIDRQARAGLARGRRRYLDG